MHFKGIYGIRIRSVQCIKTLVMMFFYLLASNIAVHNFNSRFVVVIASGYDDQREPLLLGYVQREPEKWGTLGDNGKKIKKIEKNPSRL